MSKRKFRPAWGQTLESGFISVLYKCEKCCLAAEILFGKEKSEGVQKKQRNNN